jgi:hypothetical protein
MVYHLKQLLFMSADFGVRNAEYYPTCALRIPISASRILLTNQMGHIVQERDGDILGRLKTVEHRKSDSGPLPKTLDYEVHSNGMKF